MEIASYVTSIREELALAAGAGGPEARAVAERITAPLESAVRLALLDALSAAADEITRDLAPGSVHLRLQGREPSFVVTLPSADAPAEPELAVTPPAGPEGEDSATARINFRLAESLKARIETAAEQSGLSVNGWLTRAAAAGLDAASPAAARRAPRGGQHYTGWVR
jgi:hypothetical protein